MVKNIIFDLDGTILNTLGDLQYNINLSLHDYGFDATYSKEEIKSLIGSGSRAAIERALKPFSVTDAEINEVYYHYSKLYELSHVERSVIYPGVFELLTALKADGYHLFCLTNKPHDIAVDVINHFFPKLFEDVIGQIEGQPVKPDTKLLGVLVEKNNIDLGKTMYVGDSDVDILTATNVKLPMTYVSWGFRTPAEVAHLKFTYQANTAEELENIIRNH